MSAKRHTRSLKDTRYLQVSCSRLNLTHSKIPKCSLLWFPMSNGANTTFPLYLQILKTFTYVVFKEMLRTFLNTMACKHRGQLLLCSLEGAIPPTLGDDWPIRRYPWGFPSLWLEPCIQRYPNYTKPRLQGLVPDRPLFLQTFTPMVLPIKQSRRAMQATL